MIALTDHGQETTAANQPQGQRSVAELTRTVSASRLSTWQRCRLQFYFRYIAGLQKPPPPAVHAGAVIHTSLEKWNVSRWRGVTIQLAELLQVFNRAWDVWQQGEAIDWHDKEPSCKIATWNALQHYVANTPIPVDERPEGVEVGVEAELGSGLPVLVGVIDLIRAGRKIVDFKSTSRKPNSALIAHTAETQMTAYGVLYREATGHKENGIEVHHLVRTKAPSFVLNEFGAVTEAQITRLFHVIEAYVEGVEREDFIPSPGIQCAACEFFNECRAWR